MEAARVGEAMAAEETAVEMAVVATVEVEVEAATAVAMVAEEMEAATAVAEMAVAEAALVAAACKAPSRRQTAGSCLCSPPSSMSLRTFPPRYRYQSGRRIACRVTPGLRSA